MKIAFLANSFHLQKTKSTDFLIELLGEWFGSVAVIPHKEAWAKLPGRRWDLIVSFQHLWRPEELDAFGATRTVMVPMFDDCPHDRTFWEPYRGIRILSFSKTLGDDLKSWGHDVLTVQYWQPVPEARGAAGLRGFFWPRTKDLGWNQIRVLLGESKWGSFHLHVTNGEDSSLPTPEERERYSLVQSSWFEDPAEARRTVSKASVYFAPRRYEGIGQAVLEAMALGMCVVAPDAPTMNEYVVHGQTGLLFDPDHPEPLDFSLVETLGQNARRAAVEGRARWEEGLPQIRDFLAAEPWPRAQAFHPILVFKGVGTAFLRRVYRALKRVLGRA